MLLGKLILLPLDYSHSGDVEHTHLVKGLDYALLQKVRSEMGKKTDAGEEADEKFKYVYLFMVNCIYIFTPKLAV